MHGNFPSAIDVIWDGWAASRSLGKGYKRSRFGGRSGVDKTGKYLCGHPQPLVDEAALDMADPVTRF